MTESSNEELYKLCLDFVQGKTTLGDFERNYHEKFIVKEYSVDRGFTPLKI